MNLENLQDIMPNEQIFIDYFKYIYLAIFLIFLFVFFAFFIKKMTKKEQIPLTKKQTAQIKLKNLDFDMTNKKELLYKFTLFSKECIEENNEENNEKLKKILKEIEPLKYQKNEIILDENLVKILKEYIDDLAI